MNVFRKKTYDYVAATYGALYITMWVAVHTAWIISWRYQHSRPHFGSSMAPFESWGLLPGLMLIVHLALIYGSPVAVSVAVAGFTVSRLRQRSSITFASILLGSVLVYVPDPFGALDWWYD